MRRGRSKVEILLKEGCVGDNEFEMIGVFFSEVKVMKEIECGE